jgi:ABC-type sulfate transport system substrate-binding protein
MLFVTCKGARNKPGAARDGKKDWIERLVKVSVSLNSGYQSHYGSRRCLAFCQSVDLVVVNKMRDIDISADIVNKIASAFSTTIPASSAFDKNVSIITVEGNIG